jgi:stage III sporulation protein AG
MAIKKWNDLILKWVKQYKYPIMIIMVGLVILLLPGKQKMDTEHIAPTNTVVEKDMAQQLSDILAKIDGVGKVEVMLTVLAGETTYYHRDEDVSGESGTSSVRQETVIITDSDRNEQPLISQVLSPRYQGAVIVCQGANQSSVKLAIVEAVSKATGLGADQISVLKMK